MKRTVTKLAVLLFALAFASEGFAQARHDEKPHGMPPPEAAPSTSQPSVIPSDSSSQTILLKDGTTLIVHADGTVYHADATGKRIRMKDGVMMEANDGTRYMMRNDAVWKAITDKGSLHPNHP